MGWGHFLLGAMTHKWLSDGDKASRYNDEASYIDDETDCDDGEAEAGFTMTPEERAEDRWINAAIVGGMLIAVFSFLGFVWWLAS